MYVKYGAYQHRDNEVVVSISRQPAETEQGLRTGFVERWQLSGFLTAATQADLETELYELFEGYGENGHDLAVYYDDGSRTPHYLINRLTKNGVRVVEGPSFPTGEGAELSTFRNYTVTLEAEFIDPGTNLLAFNETLSFDGGGPLFGHLQTLNGKPQKQRLAENTPYTVLQEGSAIGAYDYPLPATPIWPAALKHAPRVRKESPKRIGPGGRPRYAEFPISWQYTFESDSALKGIPHFGW